MWGVLHSLLVDVFNSAEIRCQFSKCCDHFELCHSTESKTADVFPALTELKTLMEIIFDDFLHISEW